MSEVIMVIGFMLAAYSIVGNDSIQTLGTFLYSNSHRKWWVLWLFSSSIMIAVILYGWFNYNQDPSYSRLNKVYDKSVSLVEARESIQLATDMMMATDPVQPVQNRIIVELNTLKERLEETKTVFVKDPASLDDSLLELETVFSSFRSELNRGDVSNTEKVALSSVSEKVTTLLARMEARRDVRNFIMWKHLIPPLALLILTRFGFPVSTSFLILITFQPAVLSSMLTKSLLGYVVAMVSALVMYTIVMRTFETRWRKEGEEGIHPIWTVFQWGSTAFLWSMWLIQDMANIFVYFPRMPDIEWLLFGIGWMVAVQAFIYYTHGGKIQRVVTSKTNTHDIRSATIVDLIYGVVLFYFKIHSNIPMSTTWVFLGLLAGREIAFALSGTEARTLKKAFKLARKDMVKAGFGLGVSVAIAFIINMA